MEGIFNFKMGCMGSYTAGLIIGRIFASEIWDAYFRDGLFLEGGGGLIIGILRYIKTGQND